MAQRVGMRSVLGFGVERAEQRPDDRQQRPFEGLEHDVASEPVGHADVDIGAHDVAPLDIADEVDADGRGEQLVGLLA